MANGAGNVDKALEELIRRVVREEMAAARGMEAAAAPSASAASSAGPGLGTVNQAVSGILQPTGQTDIMGAVLRGALALAGRCALFIRRGDHLSVWRTEGYSSQTTAALRTVTVSATQRGIFKDLCDTQRPICRQRVAGALPQELEQALGSAAGPHVCLLPVVVQSKVVAALYSDAGGSAGSDEMSGLEILARVAGLSLETAGMRASAQGEPQVAASAAMETPSGPVRMETGAAESIAASPVAVAEEAPSRGSFAATVALVAEAPAELSPLPDVESLPEEDRESHRKAHRFARVAVQDLLSYHRDKIPDGRRNRNLFVVLRNDIEKTRENYQRRFGQTAARSFDYLHYEMISKLAGNDPGVLGDQYPGPWSG